MSDNALFTLKVLKEQGVLSGELTFIQEVALRFAMIDTDEVTAEKQTQVIKALQMFINPYAYKHVYGIEDDPDEAPEGMEETDKFVDINDPESLDEYLMYAYEQAQVKNSIFTNGGQEIQVQVGG